MWKQIFFQILNVNISCNICQKSFAFVKLSKHDTLVIYRNWFKWLGNIPLCLQVEMY